MVHCVSGTWADCIITEPDADLEAGAPSGEGTGDGSGDWNAGADGGYACAAGTIDLVDLTTVPAAPQIDAIDCTTLQPIPDPGSDPVPTWDAVGDTLDLSRLLAGLAFRAGTDLLSEWLSAVSDGHHTVCQTVGDELWDGFGYGYAEAVIPQGIEEPVSADDQMADNQLLIG